MADCRTKIIREDCGIVKVGDGKVTLTQCGEELGDFTMDQCENITIDIPCPDVLGGIVEKVYPSQFVEFEGPKNVGQFKDWGNPDNAYYGDQTTTGFLLQNCHPSDPVIVPMPPDANGAFVDIQFDLNIEPSIHSVDHPLYNLPTPAELFVDCNARLIILNGGTYDQAGVETAMFSRMDMEFPVSLNKNALGQFIDVQGIVEVWGDNGDKLSHSLLYLNADLNRTPASTTDWGNSGNRRAR